MNVDTLFASVGAIVRRHPGGVNMGGQRACQRGLHRFCPYL